MIGVRYSKNCEDPNWGYGVGEGFHGQVMMCWPADRDEIRRLSKVGNSEPFVPTVEHSLSDCDSCSRKIWIGPQQLQLVKSPFVSAKKLCMFCVARVQKTLGLNPKEVDINPALRTARRRTA